MNKKNEHSSQKTEKNISKYTILRKTWKAFLVLFILLDLLGDMSQYKSAYWYVKAVSFCSLGYSLCHDLFFKKRPSYLDRNSIWALVEKPTTELNIHYVISRITEAVALSILSASLLAKYAHALGKIGEQLSLHCDNMRVLFFGGNVQFASPVDTYTNSVARRLRDISSSLENFLPSSLCNMICTQSNYDNYLTITMKATFSLTVVIILPPALIIGLLSRLKSVIFGDGSQKQKFTPKKKNVLIPTDLLLEFNETAGPHKALSKDCYNKQGLDIKIC